jgi:hypothetical protein
MSAEIFSLVIAYRYFVTFLFICFLPGLALSCLLFPLSRLNRLERIFISSSSSIALSSLLATALILLQNRLNPFNFAFSILTMTTIFFVASLWRTRKLNQGTESLTRAPHSARRQFGKPVWLVTVLILFSLFIFIAGNYHWNPPPTKDLPAIKMNREKRIKTVV